MATRVYTLSARAACIILLLIAPLPLIAETGNLHAGEKYDLELENGSVLKSALFREHKAGADYFDVPGLGEKLRIQNYRVLPPARPRAWHVSTSFAALAPLDQPALGFNAGLQFGVAGAISLWPAAPSVFPQVAARASFLRLSGDKAILSGPEFSAGPSWHLPLGSSKNHNLRAALFAGTGFYELLNRNIESKYSQTTFIATAELGYVYRSGHWGYAASYTHTYFYDTNFPVHAGGIALAITYFNEDL